MDRLGLAVKRPRDAHADRAVSALSPAAELRRCDNLEFCQPAATPNVDVKFEMSHSKALLEVELVANGIRAALGK